MLDIFNDDAFSLVPLTDAINKIKFVPGRLGAMGLFNATPVTTTTIGIEEKEGQLSLVSPSARGGPGNTMDKNKRTMRSLSIPHFQLDDAVMAEEVANIRAWGTETQVETVMGKVSDRMGVLSQSLDATEEYARIGAIKGTITYADASTLNLFTTFGVTAQTEVDFDLDNASPASGALRKKCATVVRTIQDELGGMPIQGVHALCSSEFFDDLIAHPEVRDTYLGWVEAQELRKGYAYGAFPFGGIMWEEYRGSVGATRYIAADKAHIFPVGVPGLFRSYYAPADYIETVNTVGQSRYAYMYPMPNRKGMNLEVQTNPLHICTRPRVLVPARRT